MSFPVAEPVVTPRAREGLRAVVPTIFPPSTVNRGESVRVRPPDLERDLLTHGTPVKRPLDFASSPKKRGPKPKLRPRGSSTEGVKRKADKPLFYRPSKTERSGETSNCHLNQTFQAESSHVQKQMGSRSSDIKFTHRWHHLKIWAWCFGTSTEGQLKWCHEPTQDDETSSENRSVSIPRSHQRAAVSEFCRRNRSVLVALFEEYGENHCY